MLLPLRVVSESRAFSKDFLSDCFLTCVARFPLPVFTVIYMQVQAEKFSLLSSNLFPLEPD